MSDPVNRLNVALEGRYAIEREIGEGGMATVYLADDLKHERKVALKVLKPELAAVVGAERFLAEIKTTAGLTHPNIVPLHDSGEADSFLFYVMPYIEGESLGDRLDREHQLPVDEAVKITTDLAEALDYAHRNKIIHRDIKPANIMLHEGRPLIADFGIALAVGAAGGGRLTETGLSLGTPFYMSPEQATGDQFVGSSTDTYALGSVLYEMLTGDPPYMGSTAQAVLGQIISSRPISAREKRPSIPANVDAALRRALEKLPADRFPSTGDFARVLVDDGFRYGEAAAQPAAPATKRWAIALLMLGLIAGGAVGSILDGEPMTQPVYLVEAPPMGTRFVEPPLPSPDGRKLAMLVTDSLGVSRVWVRSLGAEDARAINGTAGASVMFWSPDSEEIAFHSAGEIRIAGIDGSGDRFVSSLAISAGIWTPDGEFVVSSGTLGIVAVPTTGGTLRTIAEGSMYRDLDLVGAGPNMLFRQFGGEVGIHTVNLSTGVRKLLVPGVQSRVRYLAPDHFVYEENRVLLAQQFAPEDMTLIGAPFPVVSDVGWDAFAGSAGGVLSYIRGLSATRRLIWLDRQGTEIGEAASESLYSEVYLSPQGRRMMFARAERGTGNIDLWVQDLEGNSPPNRFTTEADIDHEATFSPDGEEVAWEAHDGGVLNLMRRPADGSAPATLVRPWGRGGGTNDWSPDGNFILYNSFDGADGGNLWAVPVDGVGEPFILQVESGGASPEGKFSPDGTWLAYVSDESGQSEIYLRRLDGMSVVGGAQRISEGGGTQPHWRLDGTELFFISGGTLNVVETRLAEERPAGTPRPLFEIDSQRMGSYDVMPDGQRFVAIVSKGAEATRSATVVLHWAAGPEGRGGRR
jgi:eukaryotic-like serine/threonine-protein kinase